MEESLPLALPAPVAVVSGDVDPQVLNPRVEHSAPPPLSVEDRLDAMFEGVGQPNLAVIPAVIHEQPSSSVTSGGSSAAPVVETGSRMPAVSDVMGESVRSSLLLVSAADSVPQALACSPLEDGEIVDSSSDRDTPDLIIDDASANDSD